jgi:hypothetical protein
MSDFKIDDRGIQLIHRREFGLIPHVRFEKYIDAARHKWRKRTSAIRAAHSRTPCRSNDTAPTSTNPLRTTKSGANSAAVVSQGSPGARSSCEDGARGVSRTERIPRSSILKSRKWRKRTSAIRAAHSRTPCRSNDTVRFEKYIDAARHFDVLSNRFFWLPQVTLIAGDVPMNQLNSSIVDFEIAKMAKTYVGNSRSTFSNTLS